MPRSRRAVLAAALGGAGAFAASAVGRVSPARAANGDPVLLGNTNTATADTLINTSSARALYGTSSNTSADAVFGNATAATGPAWGVRGYSSSTGGTGVNGFAGGASGQTYGVVGGAASPQGTGVYGSGLWRGVQGASSEGHAVHGQATGPAAWAGWFDGKVFTNSFIEFREGGTPPRPDPNRARLFVRDNGSGKTQLCVRFANGTIRVLAVQ